MLKILKIRQVGIFGLLALTVGYFTLRGLKYFVYFLSVIIIYNK